MIGLRCIVYLVLLLLHLPPQALLRSGVTVVSCCQVHSFGASIVPRPNFRNAGMTNCCDIGPNRECVGYFMADGSQAGSAFVGVAALRWAHAMNSECWRKRSELLFALLQQTTRRSPLQKFRKFSPLGLPLTM